MLCLSLKLRLWGSSNLKSNIDIRGFFVNDNLDMKEYLEHKYGTYEEAKKEREELKQMRIAEIEKAIIAMIEVLNTHEDVIKDSTHGRHVPIVLRAHYAMVTKNIHMDLKTLRQQLFMECMNFEYDFEL